MNRQFKKEKFKMTDKYMQRCSTSSVIKGMKIETTAIKCFKFVRMEKNKVG